jgi:hypothetical protein
MQRQHTNGVVGENVREQPALDAVRGQRRSLRRALDEVERAAASAAPGRAGAWAAHLAEAFTELRTTWELHVRVTEAPGGLFEEVLSVAPRLDSIVRRFRREHGMVAEDIERELLRLRTWADGANVTGAQVDEVRRRVTRILGRIVRHRQQGADLVYEAYAVDIGGES